MTINIVIGGTSVPLKKAQPGLYQTDGTLATRVTLIRNPKKDMDKVIVYHGECGHIVFQEWRRRASLRTTIGQVATRQFVQQAVTAAEELMAGGCV